ncbi:hypothetical protein [Endozoicomonas sp. 8E]|uniref:hypothetical protein n=1 Tax=Endozoicomonas sp. 8E TaxID=3035692 RepID=UPI002939469C|nr:hypothetical protein [Endozoicomonas sp. 8E]WOG26296.1 hypothetical protein P6910_17225 [Endozoicomonas sp. 8E]
MSLRTRIESLVPRLAHFKSEVSQQVKALHPKKVLVRNWGRFVQGMKIAAFHAKRLAHGISDRIPRVRITARRVVQIRAEEALMGNRIKAKSKEGIPLSPDQSEFLKKQAGFEVRSRDVGPDGSKTTVDYLVKVKSSALKEANKQFETDLEAYAKARVAFDAKMQKRPVTPEERREVVRLEQNMKDSQYFLADLRHWATELKYKELGGQFNTEAALRDAIRVHVKTLGLQKSNAFNLVQGVTDNIASVTQDRLDIDSRIREISDKYRNRVYKDIIAFVDNPDEHSEHNTLVRAQRNRQMIWGTDKLQFATAEAGHSKRLPGLDYYMCAAKENWPQGEPVYKDRLVLEAVRLMHNDWSLFASDVQSEIDKIRVDIDKENGVGSFDSERMWEYHHLRSFQETLSKLRRFATQDADSTSRVVDFLSTYGEELGLGEHPGYNLDVLTKEAQARYGVNSFKQLEESVTRTEKGTAEHLEYLPIPPFGQTPPLVQPAVNNRFTGGASIPSTDPFLSDLQEQQAPSEVFKLAPWPTDTTSPVSSPLPPPQGFGNEWEAFGEPDTSESEDPSQGSEKGSQNNRNTF